MAKITFSKLNLKMKSETKQLALNDNITLDIIQYLPQQEKADLVSWVLTNALDPTTNTFSPIRLETYFALAIAKWYAGIAFTDKQIENAPKTYDILESNDVFARIIDTIPEDEFKYINNCVNDTAKTVTDYSSSFAGMISNMNTDASGLNEQLTDILVKIKDKQGLEELAVIRDIMGKAE